MKIDFFSENVKSGKFSRVSEKFFGDRGKSERGGKCIIALGVIHTLQHNYVWI